MHLLFYGKEEIKLLGNKRVDELLREESIKVCDVPISMEWDLT